MMALASSAKSILFYLLISFSQVIKAGGKKAKGTKTGVER